MPTWTIERNKVVAHVDVDVIHIGIGHCAARMMVGDEPLHDFALAAGNAEIDRLPRSMLGGAAGGGDACAGTARRDHLYMTETGLETAQQGAGLGRQTACAGTRLATAH